MLRAWDTGRTETGQALCLRKPTKQEQDRIGSATWQSGSKSLFPIYCPSPLFGLSFPLCKTDCRAMLVEVNWDQRGPQRRAASSPPCTELVSTCNGLPGPLGCGVGDDPF